MRMLAKLIGNGVPARVWLTVIHIPPPVRKNRLRRDIPPECLPEALSHQRTLQLSSEI